MTAAPSMNRTNEESTTLPALMVENLSAGYPGHNRAVDNVSFGVMPGERVAIIGPNGAGKSTLFKAIVGLIPHNTGEISIHGEDCHTSHSMVGYVPQQEEIDWTFPVTVYDVVLMGRTRKIGWLRIAGKRDREAVMNALEQVGMARFAKRQICELSGGQKRRVFIARALTQETDVLLLDEPFSGVDLSAENEIMETLDELQSAKFTLLLATHDLHKASTEFDRLLLLNQRVIAFGDPKTAFTPDNLRLAYGGRIGVFSQNGKTMIIADEHGHD
jgi:ABC-type Mn2+/Zn2+ transport system ATPase subunit